MGGRPFDGSQKGGYGQAIGMLQKHLDTMNTLTGPALQAYADRFFISKPELTDALQKLRTMESQARKYLAMQDQAQPKRRLTYAERHGPPPGTARPK